MMVDILCLVVALGGVFVYLVVNEPKVSTLGLWTFGAGLFAFLLRVLRVLRVRMAKLLLVVVAGIALVVNAQTSSQTTHDIKGATVTVSKLDSDHGSATLDVLNQSDKDITAYSVAVEAVWRDHQVNRSEKMLDCGAILTGKSEVLHPGQTGTQPLIYSTKPSNPLVAIKATLVALVFADQTSEASSSEALDRIVDARQSMASLTRVSAEAVSQALASTAPHPGARAASIIRDQISKLPPPTSVGFKGYMEPVAEELENGPKRAERMGVTEREYLEHHLTELQERLQQQEAYAVIRRQQ